MPTGNNQGRRSCAPLLRLLPLLAVAGIVAWIVIRTRRPSADDLLRDANRAFEEQRYADARSLADRVLEIDSESEPALLIAGDAERRAENLAAALEYYSRIRSESSAEAIAARFHSGQVLLQLGQATLAENQFRRLLTSDPNHLEANLELTKLLAAECRKRDAIPFVLALLRQGRVDVDLLTLLSIDDGGVIDPDLLKRCNKANPNDARVLLGLACAARMSHREDEALRHIRRATKLEPELVDAQARLGSMLWKEKSEREFAAWLDRQGPKADGHPGIWSLRGLWEEKQNRPRTAIRCYWEALRIDPNDQTANYRLAMLLESIGRRSQAAPFLKRAAALARLVQLRDALLNTEQSSLEPVRQVVEHLNSLGRPWEALGWCQVALRIDPSATWFETMLSRLRVRVRGLKELTSPGSNPALRINLADFPLPKRDSGASTGSVVKSVPEWGAAISFQDTAADAGLSFRYFNSPGKRNSGQKMYEFNGGGCAVLDFDGDGRPDLHFTQGCPWPVAQDRITHTDRLYRNVGNGNFTDVTAPAGLEENRFTLGVTVGDYDNDGFDDLYVANIGRNRLYRNNGDGTFGDVTEVAGVDDPRWTTSCLMADLNGDGLPDIYTVNYLQATDVFQRVCSHADGTPRMCMPFHFPAAPDQLYLNLGDGRFENVTAKSGVAVANGKGLGVVAADWTGDGRLSLFVANDTVANFFFVNRTTVNDRYPRFEERAVLSGLAFNRNGQAEGCMGIAVGDPFGDGKPSLFVTNFYQETNTLYRNIGGLTFEDQTQTSGLAAPSVAMLGFGAQFLDADLDGHSDLIVTNGHIDDYRKFGRPYRMRMQFFRNRGDGRFDEMDSKQLGPFFAAKRLGRGLARLDWNQDGREDVVVSHLDSPAALLTNTTRNAARFIALRFRGVAGSRDAIGVTVHIHYGKRTLVQQLTAGDGYQASNERRMVFGLGTENSVRHMTIRWPSGRVRQFRDIPANREFMAIEGRRELLELPRGFFGPGR